MTSGEQGVAGAAYVCRPLAAADLAEVAETLQAVFGVPFGAEHLRWKLLGNGSRSGPALSTALIHAGRIVGIHGHVPVRFRVGPRELRAVQGTDFAVLEGHRRLDAFLGMVSASSERLKRAGVAFAYGVPLDEAAAVNLGLLGQHVLAPVPLLVKALSIGGRMAADGTRASVRSAGRALQRVEMRLRKPHLDIPDGLALHRVDRFDDRFDAFWARVRSDYPVMCVRDAAHLNWRFADAVGRRYEAYCLADGEGRVAGYVVLGWSDGGCAGRARIADLVTPRDGTRDVARCLVRQALRRFLEAGIGTADCWMFPHAHVYAALRAEGFLPRDKAKRAVHVGTVDRDTLTPAGEALLTDVKNWYLTMGDCDHG
jgi:hypothetical protein